MIKELLELVFPENIYCICCGSIIDKKRYYSLCDTCMSQFHWQNGRTCRICGKKLQDSYSNDICYFCMEHEHHFDKVFSCVSYGINERAVVADMKYKDMPYIGRKIGAMMADRMEFEEYEFDAVTAVPIHENRRKERGYNQAEIAAKEFAKRMNLRYTDCVSRIKDTKPMKGLSPEERYENLNDAFEITEEVKGKTILVVDDIYTTGTSLDEISRLLKEKGAAKVFGLCFASAVNRRPFEED